MDIIVYCKVNWIPPYTYIHTLFTVGSPSATIKGTNMNINHCTQVGSTTKMSLPPASNNEQIQIPRAPAAPIAENMAEAPPVQAVDVPPNPEVGQVQEVNIISFVVSPCDFKKCRSARDSPPSYFTSTAQVVVFYP